MGTRVEQAGKFLPCASRAGCRQPEDMADPLHRLPPTAEDLQVVISRRNWALLLQGGFCITLKVKSQTVRGWRLHLRTTRDLAELAEWINPIIRGWMDYYGTFYRQEMRGLLLRINTYLVRWARRKFKRLRSFKRA